LIFSGFNERLIKKLINMSRGSEGVCVMMSQGILREATLLQLKQYSAAKKRNPVHVVMGTSNHKKRLSMNYKWLKGLLTSFLATKLA